MGEVPEEPVFLVPDEVDLVPLLAWVVVPDRVVVEPDWVLGALFVGVLLSWVLEPPWVEVSVLV